MKTILASLLLLATLAGCGVRSPIAARKDPYVPSQVQLAEENLRRNTAFGEPLVSRDQAGLLFVTLPIRAATELTLYVDYRVTFVDRTGRPLQQTGWRSKTLYPNVFDHIAVNSTSPEAVDFTIDVRYAR
jgi:hypothetical protein